MFRRRKAEQGDLPDPSADRVDQDDEGMDVEVARRTGPRADGPWDLDEVEVSEDDGRIDLGSLLVTPVEGLDLQLQVDESTGQVVAVLLAGAEGALELRAFAAPRNGDVWDDVRRQVSAEIARMGGTATEGEGRWGTELRVSLTVNTPDGGRAQQVSRVVGISGPRWLLRATMFGGAAIEYRRDGPVETALREVVVVRGTGPVPPGDPLPLTVPPNAQRVDPE